MKYIETTLPSGAKLTGWLREPAEEMPHYQVRPAVLVLPGGGYAYCSAREADPVATQFFAAGYQVFTLWYSVAPKAGNWQPMIDAAGAILHLRKNAVEFSLNPDKVVVCGFSAGGHLAASTAILWDAAPLRAALGIAGEEARPNAVVLGYPVVTSGPFAHVGSIDNIAGDDKALRDMFSLENQVKPGLPPFFIWHTVTDASVPVQNSLLLVNALERCDVPYELHLFATGNHGMSVCTDEVNTPSAHNATWVPLCMQWLELTLDYHI